MNLNVRFHRGSGWGGSLVRQWTNSQIGHCDLVFPDGVTLDVRPEVGVRFAHVSLIPPMSIVAQVPVTITDAGMDCLIAWARGDDVIGQGYDFYGAAAAGLPIIAREHDTKWFCSEAVSRALQIGSVLSYRITPWRQTPLSLYELLPPS